MRSNVKPLKRSDIKREPIVRDDPLVPSGISVWAVILWLKQHNWDHDKVIDLLQGDLTAADIEYAERFYGEYHDEIEFRLRQIAGTLYTRD
jgi:hypothetical protein